MYRNQNPLRSPWDLDDVYTHPRWSRYGITPDVRPPYLASYGLHDYDPAANWAAARRSAWGVRATPRLGEHGMEGRGPRGYTRSDSRIEEDINELLTRDPELDASDIDVRVSGGVVELSGTVRDRWGKRRAYDDAESCPGVREVRSSLRVSREGRR